MADDLWNCRVCGYRNDDEPPWGDGESPNYEFCPCCGVEAGVHDASPHAARAYRARWLASGAPWFMPGAEHDGLTTQERLSHVPARFA